MASQSSWELRVDGPLRLALVDSAPAVPAAVKGMVGRHPLCCPHATLDFPGTAVLNGVNMSRRNLASDCRKSRAQCQRPRRPCVVTALQPVGRLGAKWLVLVFALGLLLSPDTVCSQSPLPLEKLLQQAQEPTPGKTNGALQILTEAGASIVPELAQMLASAHISAQIRANAALAIGAIAYHYPVSPELRQVVPLLARCLQDADTGVQIQSAQALGAIGEAATEAVPFLVEASGSTNQGLRFCSLEALGRIGPSSRAAVPHLKAALGDSSEDIRTIAAQALTRITGAPAADSASQPALAGFFAEGVFSNLTYGTTGNVERSTGGSFVARVEGAKWKIRTTRSDEALDYFEAGSDDLQQIYLLGSHTNRTAPAAAERSPSQGVPELEKAFGRIQLGRVPHFNDPEAICILWLAYASGSYFASRTNQQIEPVYWFGGQAFFDRNLTLPAEWVLAKRPPCLPIQVVYFNDGFTRGVDGSGAPRVIPNQEPWQGGYTNAIYCVEKSFELGRHSIPGSFRLDIFRPKPNGQSSTDLLLSRSFKFTLTRAGLLEGRENFIPSIPGRTYVKDRRFIRNTNSADLGYVVSSRWPPPPAARAPRYVLLLTLCALPLAWFAARRKRQP
jgi:hypothetical protein